MKKKLLTLLLSLSVVTLSLIGCSSNETATENNPFNKFSYTCKNSNIVVNATDVSATGMSLTYTWPDYNGTNEMSVDSVYYIEEWNGDEWLTRGLKSDISPDFTFASSFRVTGDGLFKDKIDWTASYGELPNGRYRFSKQILTGNSNYETFYIEFVVQ